MAYKLFNVICILGQDISDIANRRFGILSARGTVIPQTFLYNYILRNHTTIELIHVGRYPSTHADQGCTLLKRSLA